MRMLPKVTSTLRHTGSQTTAEIILLPKTGTFPTGSLCLLLGSINSFAVFKAGMYVCMYVFYFLSTSSIQDTGDTTYKVPFLKTVLHSNGENKTYTGIYKLTSSW